MATYHLSVKNGKKGKAVEHAKYISRQGKHRQDGKSDLVVVAHGNLPEWAQNNPLAFWRAADYYERSNGAAYREFELALPNELNVEQQKDLLNEFIGKQLGSRPFHVAIHAPPASLGKLPQPHAHLMFSDRLDDGLNRPPELHFKRFNAADPAIGGCKKVSGGKDRTAMQEMLSAIRQEWAAIQNAFLERAGFDARVDHRSNRSRKIEKAPERHLGHVGIKSMSDDEKAQFTARRTLKVESFDTESKRRFDKPENELDTKLES